MTPSAFRALIVAAVLAFVFGAELAYAEPPKELRVLCYNVHHCAGVDRKLDVDRIAQVIRSVKPDLVALQEIDKNTERTGRVDQARQIARKTEMFKAFGANISFQGGEYGNAVLSRFQILSWKNHELPNHRDGEQRGVLQVTIDAGFAKPIVFCSTHFDHRKNASERVASAKWLNEQIAPLGKSLIVAGDLNDDMQSDMFRVLSQRWRSANTKPLPTIPVKTPTRQIDFILLPKASPWKVVKVEVLKEAVASDHRAILAVLKP